MNRCPNISFAWRSSPPSQVLYCANFGTGSALCDDLVPTLGSCDFKASTFVCTFANFTTRWNVSASATFVFPLATLGTYNFAIHWGDGSSGLCTDSNCTHVYNQSGIYDVVAQGVIRGFSMKNSPVDQKLLDVLEWGDACLGDGGYQLQGIKFESWSAADEPCLSGVRDSDSHPLASPLLYV
eukprot:g61437.t1